ncbi:MAG: 4Fe-4S binding protein [Coriobacteriales bacterium]|jgi:ferredoxin
MDVTGETLSRRGFVGTMAGTAAVVGAVAAGVGAAAGAARPEVAHAQTVLDPERVSDEYTNAELDAMILDESPVNGDYTAPNGKTIPAVYLRLRNRVNRIGYGLGSQIEGNGTEWDFLMRMFSEDDAEHYLEMPMYKDFNAGDYAALTGRTAEEADEILQDMGSRGLLCTRYRSGEPYYHLLTSEWGIWEYNLDRYYEDGFMVDHNNRAGDDMKIEINDNVRPQLNVMPVAKSVIRGEMAPHTSWEEIFKRNEIIGVAPCQCRSRANMLGISAQDCEAEHPKETCMIFGDVAKYYIERGEARQLTQQEAIALEIDIIDHGMVPEAQWTKQVDFMCNCKSDCCLILSEYAAANGAGNVMPQVSRYNLVYDKDACIKCGACIERCPMQAIAFGDDGYCVMDAKCVRCGQCALVCPASARCLEAKPSEEWMALPDDMMTDYLDEARRRAASGMLYDFTENGLTEPAVQKYTSSDGFTLDAGAVTRLIPAGEVPTSEPTGLDADDAALPDVAKDAELSEVLSNLDLMAYNKQAYRVTEPTQAAQDLAASMMDGATDKAQAYIDLVGRLVDRSGAVPADGGILASAAADSKAGAGSSAADAR